MMSKKSWKLPPQIWNITHMKVKVKSLSRVWLFVTPWTVAYQAPLSMGFSRQEFWSGLPFPSPDYGDNLNDSRFLITIQKTVVYFQTTFFFFYNLWKNFFKFICFSWRLITLQYCSGFWHTLIWMPWIYMFKYWNKRTANWEFYIQ